MGPWWCTGLIRGGALDHDMSLAYRFSILAARCAVVIPNKTPLAGAYSPKGIRLPVCITAHHSEPRRWENPGQ